MLYCQLTQVQINAYSIYSIANKFLNMPVNGIQEIENTLKFRLDAQKDAYYYAPYRQPSFKTELDYYISRLPDEILYTCFNTAGGGKLIEASDGCFLLSIDINIEGVSSGYQGKMTDNGVEISRVAGEDINYLFPQNISYINGILGLESGYCMVDEPNTYITGIYADCSNRDDPNKIKIRTNVMDEYGYLVPNSTKFIPMTMTGMQQIPQEMYFLRRKIKLPVDIKDKFIGLLTGVKYNANQDGVISFELMNNFHELSYQFESIGPDNTNPFFNGIRYWANEEDESMHNVEKDS